MALKDILTLVITIASFLLTCLIPTVIVMIQKIKEARKTKNYGEIAELAQQFVVEAENLYKDIDGIVKGQGKSCGALKKDSVMTKIMDACISRKTKFDKEFWSDAVDKLVEVTRQVNAKQESK